MRPRSGPQITTARANLRMPLRNVGAAGPRDPAAAGGSPGSGSARLVGGHQRAGGGLCPFCDGRRVARVPFPDRGGKAAPARARESGRRWGASVRVVLEPPAVRPELVARRQDDRLRRGIRTADRPEARCRRCRADVHDQRGQAVLVAGGRRDRLLDGADRAVSVRAQGHDERRSNDADGGGPVRRSERDAAGRYRATRLVSRRQAHRVRASTGDLERAFCGRAGHSAGGRWPTWNTPRTCTVLRQRRSAARIRQVVRQRPRWTDRLAARRTRPPKRPRAHTRERIDESRGRGPRAPIVVAGQRRGRLRRGGNDRGERANRPKRRKRQPLPGPARDGRRAGLGRRRPELLHQGRRGDAGDLASPRLAVVRPVAARRVHPPLVPAEPLRVRAAAGRGEVDAAAGLHRRLLLARGSHRTEIASRQRGRQQHVDPLRPVHGAGGRRNSTGRRATARHGTGCDEHLGAS